MYCEYGRTLVTEKIQEERSLFFIDVMFQDTPVFHFFLIHHIHL